MAKLLVHETAGVREFELVDVEIRIGRELDNSLRLVDPSISRHHAVVRKTVEGFEVEDLGSSNGVLVNGNRVVTSPVQDGDRLTLGQVQLTFVNPPVVANPLGTVRMSVEDMARILTVPAAAGEAVEVPAAVPAPVLPLPEVEVAPAIELRPEPPAAPSVPPPPVPPMAPLRAAPVAPEGGKNPLPDWLQGFFPGVPDDAQPTGERGDFLTRLLAVLIDGAIMFVLFLPLRFLMIMPVIGLLFMALGALVEVALLVGTVWCWMHFGATPGKKLMKLRVVPEEDPLGRISLEQGIFRCLGHMLNGLLCCLPYLMIFGAERTGFQDRFSRSLVIKVDR